MVSDIEHELIVQPADRGTVNGFGQSTAALGRMLGPIIGAPVFAWSETSGMYYNRYNTTLDSSILYLQGRAGH